MSYGVRQKLELRKFGDNHEDELNFFTPKDQTIVHKTTNAPVAQKKRRVENTSHYGVEEKDKKEELNVHGDCQKEKLIAEEEEKTNGEGVTNIRINSDKKKFAIIAFWLQEKNI